MRKLIAAAATIAMAGSMAYAQPGNNPGKGQGNDKRQAAQDDRGPGNGNGSGNAKGNANRSPQIQRANENRGNGNERAQGQGKARATYDNPGQGNRANGKSQGNSGYRDDRGRDYGDDLRRGFRDRDGNLIDRIARWPDDRRYGIVDGCPPGLRKKNPPCVPPGLARQQQGYFGSGYYRPSFFGLGGIPDGRYYYDDGYLMRVGGNNIVSAFVPLLGGALGIGNVWPSYYQPVAVPRYYQDYYNLGPNGYRYADNVLYRVDPESAAITSIAALLTGDEFRVGQPMPAGYDVYNVPYGYRDRYYDRPDAYYRYADGYVYQVDPETRLIAAAIELLV